MSFVPLKAKARAGDTGLQWLSGVIRAFPVNAVPNKDTVEFVSDVSATEIGSSRVTLASRAINEDTAGDEAELDAADPTHPDVQTGDTALGTVYYCQVGGDDLTPADDFLVAFGEYPSGVPTNGGDILVQLAAEGAVKL